MIHDIVDAITNPRVAVPAVTGGAAANILAHLPDFINVCMAFYVVLLVSHKAWVMWREYKAGKEVKDGD